ncbi:MAG: hypothetical protein WBZ36_16395 [Candidatus Nitrosopolaris sp.]
MQEEIPFILVGTSHDKAYANEHRQLAIICSAITIKGGYSAWKEYGNKREG